MIVAAVGGFVGMTVRAAPATGGDRQSAGGETALSALPWDTASGLTWAAQLGGGVGGLAALIDEAGQWLYVGVGSRVEVYDVHDAERPLRVGASVMLPSQASVMRVEGRYLHAAVVGGGLYVFDVADGRAPRLLGGLPGVTMSVTEIELRDGYVFMADRATGLVVVNVSRPDEPVLVGLTAFARTEEGGDPLHPRALASRGTDLALVANDTTPGERGDGHELILLDAADPAALRERGRLLFRASNPSGIVWRGDALFLGTDRGPLVLDVADLSAPRELGLVSPGEGLLLGTLRPGDDHLYQVANVGGGRETALVEYALPGPGGLQVVAVHHGGPFGSLLVDGGRVYSASNADGQVAIYDKTAGAAPVPRATIDLPGFVSDGTWAEGTGWFLGETSLYSFAADGRGGVEAVRRLQITGTRLALATGRLYVAAGGSGLRTIDVVDPGKPRELAPLPLSPTGRLLNVVVAGDRGYCIIWPGRGGLPSDLWVLDLARPEGPAIVGSVQLSIGWNGIAEMATVGDVLLVSSDAGPSSRDIIAVDVSDAAAPRELYRYRLPEHVWALTVDAVGTIYAGTSDGLVVLDLVAEPILLRERTRWRAGTADAPRAVRGLALRDNRVIVLLGYASADGGTTEGTDPLGHRAAIRVLQIRPDGSIDAAHEVPIAAALGSSASYRLFGAGPYIGAVSAGMGLNLVRDDAVLGRDGVVLFPSVANDAP